MFGLLFLNAFVNAACEEISIGIDETLSARTWRFSTVNNLESKAFERLRAASFRSKKEVEASINFSIFDVSPKANPADIALNQLVMSLNDLGEINYIGPAYSRVFFVVNKKLYHQVLGGPSQELATLDLSCDKRNFYCYFLDVDKIFSQNAQALIRINLNLEALESENALQLFISGRETNMLESAKLIKKTDK